MPGRAHALRKASAIRQAPAGATAFQPMAWHGWRTIQEAQKYVEQASRIRLAAALISGTQIVSAADLLRQIGEKTK